MTAIDSALNPDIDRPTSHERPLSNTEQMQRNKALCAANGRPDSLSCSGNLFIGMFFDGTGNNEVLAKRIALVDLIAGTGTMKRCGYPFLA